MSCADENAASDTLPLSTDEEIFTQVDTYPRPINGMEAFYGEVSTKLKYPTQARRMGIEGKVFISFVVQESGNITDVKVLKGIGAGCDEAAASVMSNVEAWSPGKIQGRPVPVLMTIPIVFKLSHSDHDQA